MKYVPSAVAAADLDIADGPAFGGEYLVYISNTPAVHIGTVNLTGPGAGTYTDNNATAIKAAGADLQLAVQNYNKSSVATVIKLAGLNNAGSPAAQDGTATFAPPARSANQSFNFQRGIAQELSAALPFTTITGLAASTPIVGGGANQQFTLWQLPELADYTLVGCTTDV